MPRGVPRLGKSVSDQAKELAESPGTAELLGTITRKQLEPKSTTSYSNVDGVTVEVTDPPPPWEVDPRYAKHSTDARKFVTVPDNWELRWINPRLLDQVGWRDWKPVMASHSDVKVKVRTMIAVDNTIRRGGQTGDILGWMYKSWVESRKRLKQESVDRLRRKVVDRFEETKEAIQRGSFGPHIKLDSAHHPTHTIGEGRTMERD